VGPWIEKRLRTLRLVFLYFARIVFVGSHHDVTLRQKLSANIGGGFLADQYALYNFAANDRWQYLSEFDWYRSRYINSPHNFMLNNKVTCSQLLRPYVRVPKVLLVKTRGRYINGDGTPPSESPVADVLALGGMLYCKPLSAGKGKDIWRLEATDQGLLLNGVAHSPEAVRALLNSRDNWYISENVEQGEYSSRLYPQTTNTIRFVVLKDATTGCFAPFFAVQRIGVAASVPVDNGSKGGLVAKIDMVTGELSSAQTLHALDAHDCHPDTGAAIKGVCVPNWNDIVHQVLALSDHFWWLHIIAWDLVLTADGIAVIEANTSTGVNIIQLWGGQRHQRLGDFYRQHGVLGTTRKRAL